MLDEKSGKISCLTLSLYQSYCHDSTSKNIEALELFVAEASKNKTHICIFPECFLQGYASGKPEIFKTAEPVNGESFKQIAKIAKKYQVAIIYGFNERVKVKERNEKVVKVYNSANFINSNGELLANYQKTHLWGEYEKNIWTQGEKEPPLIELFGRKLGLLICYDFEFPEMCRCLALKGAEIVITIAACCSDNVPNTFPPCRAAENNFVVVYLNRYGVDNGCLREGGIRAGFCGLSSVFGPDGDAIAKLGFMEKELHNVHINFDSITYKLARASNPYFQDRRNELYPTLLEINRI